MAKARLRCAIHCQSQSVGKVIEFRGSSWARVREQAVKWMPLVLELDLVAKKAPEAEMKSFDMI